jgi:hypothetical protein
MCSVLSFSPQSIAIRDVAPSKPAQSQESCARGTTRNQGARWRIKEKRGRTLTLRRSAMLMLSHTLLCSRRSGLRGHVNASTTTIPHASWLDLDVAVLSRCSTGHCAVPALRWLCVCGLYAFLQNGLCYAAVLHRAQSVYSGAGDQMLVLHRSNSGR